MRPGASCLSWHQSPRRDLVDEEEGGTSMLELPGVRGLMGTPLAADVNRISALHLNGEVGVWFVDLTDSFFIFRGKKRVFRV